MVRRQETLLTEEEREFLDQLLPIELYDDYYNPYLVDPIKWAPDFDMDFLEANKSEFFKTWWSILKRHFGTYVEQYLMGTYGFWHIGGELPYEFVKTDISENTWGLYQAEILYQYFDYDMKAALWEKYDYIASGLLIWILLYDVVLCWMRKKTVYILPLLVFVGNWMTLMIATPIAFGIRYVYVCVIGLPLLIVYGFMLSNGEGIPGEKKKQGVENVADAGVKGRGDL